MDNRPLFFAARDEKDFFSFFAVRSRSPPGPPIHNSNRVGEPKPNRTARFPKMRDSNSQASIAKHTGQPERRLVSCAAHLSTLASNLIAFYPAAHYRGQAAKLKAYGRGPGCRRGLSGRVTEGGMLARLMSGTDGEPATTYAQFIHRDATGSPVAVVISKETAWASDRLSGARRAGDVRAVPNSALDRRMMGESTHVGLTPSVLTESCPSLGRSRKGGAVPPETNGQLS